MGGRWRMTKDGRGAPERPALAVGPLVVPWDAIRERRRRPAVLPSSQHGFGVFPGQGACSRTIGSQNQGQDKPPSHSL